MHENINKLKATDRVKDQAQVYTNNPQDTQVAWADAASRGSVGGGRQRSSWRRRRQAGSLHDEIFIGGGATLCT